MTLTQARSLIHDTHRELSYVPTSICISNADFNELLKEFVGSPLFLETGERYLTILNVKVIEKSRK